MKKAFLLNFALLLMAAGAKAQGSDVTSIYIVNPGFEDCEALPVSVVHDNLKDIDVKVAACFGSYSEARGTDFSANGWRLVEQITGGNGAVIDYSTTERVQHKSYNNAGDPSPKTGPEGTTGTKGLLFAGVKSVVYQVWVFTHLIL
jgi:hypothetical protein